jgi:hypothetical protein
MWGNALGWTISFFIIAATAAGLVYVQRLDHPTPQTALVADPQNLAELELPIDPATLLPELKGQADATELFRRAAAAYQSDPVTYDRAAEGEISDDFITLPAIAPLIDGAMARGETVLADAPEETVTFKPRARLTALRVLGDAVIRGGMYREKDDPAAAIKLYNAALALGSKMCAERLVFAEFMGGLDVMGQAVSRLGRLSKDPNRVQQFAAFQDAQRTAIAPRVNPIWQVLGSIDPQEISTHAGDIRVLAKSAKEPMWRVEAAFALGRTKFAAQNGRDRIAAQQLLEELSSSGEQDAIVRLAAQAAKSMTADDYRQLH